MEPTVHSSGPYTIIPRDMPIRDGPDQQTVGALQGKANGILSYVGHTVSL
jgi:hypothetical protein